LDEYTNTDNIQCKRREQFNEVKIAGGKAHNHTIKRNNRKLGPCIPTTQIWEKFQLHKPNLMQEKKPRVMYPTFANNAC
jgi:hypothetical protein